MAETTYMVLRSVTDEPDASDWTEVVPVNASSAVQAIRNALVGPVTKDGTYVAIPLRSWKPVTVKVETTTVLKLDPPPGSSR